MYRKLLATHRLIGSMSRRGNPYDNAKAESFMKTLKVEAVYLAATRRSRTSPPILHAS
jgi:putative transposase